MLSSRSTIRYENVLFYDPRDEILSTYTASYEISKNAEKCLPFPFRCFLFDRAILVFSERFFNRLRPKKKQKNIQQFLTKILRLESGAKECIV